MGAFRRFDEGRIHGTVRREGTLPEFRLMPLAERLMRI